MPRPTEGARERELREVLAVRTATSPEDWYLVFKARYGLEVAFEGLAALGHRDPVATQVFTCCTAVDPILAAGLEARYLDVDADLLALSARAVEGERGCFSAVVAQHSFGIVDDEATAALAKAAHAKGAILVEDCAHCASRVARGPEGPVADVSVHSFGVEKLLPTARFGGAVWLNPAMADTELRAHLAERFANLPEIPKSLEKACRAYVNQTRILNHLPAAAAAKLNDSWTAKGRREPAISPVELKGGLARSPEAPGEWVASVAAADLIALDENLALRRRTVAALAEALAGAEGLSIPAGARDVEHPQPLVCFPVFLDDPERAALALEAVRASGFYAVPWYRPLLFPGVELSAFDIADFGAWPVSSRLSAGALALPADVGVERAREAAQIVLATL